MKTIFRKAFMALLIAVCTAVFSGFRAAHAAPAMDETNGVYADDFADVSGVANFTGTEISSGAVKLINGGTAETPTYGASGTATLNAVQPLRIAKWNTLSIVASTPPGTSIKAQFIDDAGHVYDDAYIPGNAAGITVFPVDLSGLPILRCGNALSGGGYYYQSCSQPGKVIARFTLSTGDAAMTPLIDFVQVSWTLSQGDLSSSEPAQGWSSFQHDMQATYNSGSANPQVYPAFRWGNTKYPGDAEALNMLVANGKVFVPTNSVGSQFLGLDSTTGAKLWQIPFGIDVPVGVITENDTFFGADWGADKAYALDMNTGQFKWSYNFYGGHGSASESAGNDGTYYYTHVTYRPDITYCEITAFNPDGTVRWSKNFYPPGFIGGDGVIGGQHPNYTGFSIGADGTLYFTYQLAILTDSTMDYIPISEGLARLVAIDPADGTTKWTHEIGDAPPWEAPLIDKDGTIYVYNNFFTRDHEIEVHAINPDGTLKWQKSYGTGDYGIINLALKSDRNLYALWNADNLTGSDNTILELNSADGSVLSNIPAGKSLYTADLPYFIVNYLTTDSVGGAYYVDADDSDPAANIARLNYRDGDHTLRWQIPFVYDSLGGKVQYSLASQIMDERGWVYSALGRYHANDGGYQLPLDQFAQPFALAPWTLVPSTSRLAYYRGDTVDFSVITSMQEKNPINDEDNLMQAVLDTGTKIPLSYSSTLENGDTVWTGSYDLPADFAFGSHGYTIQAEQPLVKTDITTAFASSATGSENTGITATGSFGVPTHAPGFGAQSVPAPAPSVAVTLPNGNNILAGGSTVAIDWTSANGAFIKYRVSYSADDGDGWAVLADSVTGNSYSWTVPQTSTKEGLIKVEGFDATGTILASDQSAADFIINGAVPAPPETTNESKNTEPPTADPTVSGMYDPALALSNNPDFNTDLGIVLTGSVSACTSGSLVKGTTLSTVYYCGADGKRYVFPSDKVFFSWYPDLSTVQTISDERLIDSPLGGNVTYRPGTRLVKIQTDPKVYAVARGGILRWVSTEAAAARLFGADWNKQIDDVADSFFVNYKVGEQIN